MAEAEKVESSNQHARLATNAHIVVQPLTPALQARSFSLATEHAGLTRAGILLTSGRGEILGGKEGASLAAPALAWLPIEHGHALRVHAGSQGYIVWLSGTLAKDALGDRAESAQLRYLVDRRVIVAEIDDAESVAELQHIFASLDRETRKSRPSSWVYLSAQVALILVNCWWISGLEDVSMRGQGVNSTILLRFRNLVELHFREQWKIARYAKEIGISHDHLHDVCVRTCQRTPLQLVHERLAYEAGQRLLRSGFTIEQIAADLGFSTTTYFTRFFSREMGSSPGRFRRDAIRSRTGSVPALLGSFADWP